MSGRREFSPHFKVQVVLEALKGERSQAQICRHPTSIAGDKLNVISRI